MREYLTIEISFLMVTTYIAHIRSRKCHVLRMLQLLKINTVVMFTALLNILGQENATF